MAMGVAHIPTSNACILCHGSGGEVKTVPGLLHPIEGWRRCVVCHTNESIGRKAPGHEGIAEEECLNCHKVSPGGPAITQPHAALQDQRCLTCHGGVAHLPSSMATTKETDCVLCHKPTAAATPVVSPCGRRLAVLPDVPPVGRGRRAADHPRPADRRHLPALPRAQVPGDA